ncbi:MAG: hypothetical protein K6U74_02540, partial [Firmicutes bacterium]|nr:hypothetical protein [Bacillota bacterium]
MTYSYTLFFNNSFQIPAHNKKFFVNGSKSRPHGAPEKNFCESLPGLLYDFYTAIEDVFEAIAGDVNGELPDGVE